MPHTASMSVRLRGVVAAVLLVLLAVPGVLLGRTAARAPAARGDSSGAGRRTRDAEISYDPDPKQVERRAWQTRIKEPFDVAALAALIK